jgi:hypothetical protein
MFASKIHYHTRELINIAGGDIRAMHTLLGRTYSNSASNISWFLPVIMYSDTNQHKSSNIPWNGSKEEPKYKPVANSVNISSNMSSYI